MKETTKKNWKTPRLKKRVRLADLVRVPTSGGTGDKIAGAIDGGNRRKL